MAAELSFLPSILSFTKNISSDLSAISDMLACMLCLDVCFTFIYFSGVLKVG